MATCEYFTLFAALMEKIERHVLLCVIYVCLQASVLLCDEVFHRVLEDNSRRIMPACGKTKRRLE